MTSREKSFWQITHLSGFFSLDDEMFWFLDNLANWWSVKYLKREDPDVHGLSVFTVGQAEDPKFVVIHG